MTAPLPGDDPQLTARADMPPQEKDGWRARLRRRLAGRPDSEHEQALIRIGFAVAIGVYILAAASGSGTFFWGGLGISAAALVLSTALFVHILVWPGISPARRIAGMLIDTVGLCGVMLVGGMSAAPFYPILLWIILGHGFRFGRTYLFAAAGTALLLFSGVVLLNAEWRQVPALDVALILALIVLPAYVSTLLRKLEQAIHRAEEANQAKSRFLAVISHEFRTPLNAVIGLSDLLRRDEPDEDRREMLGTVRTAAGTILGLVDAVLDAAKIEAGRFTVITQPFDLDGLLGILRGMLEQQAQARGLRLRLVLDPGVPSALVGDQAALQQVLTNLVANALKFTERGEVVLRVQMAGRGQEVLFAVSDTGIGIPLDRQQRIFESFTQADDGTDRDYGGTGLGLTIAKELVELMGGRLALQSEPGRGTTFSFTLLLPAADLDDLPVLPSHGLVVVLGRGQLAVRAQEILERAGFGAQRAGSLEDVATKLHRRHGRRLLVMADPATSSSAAELIGIVLHKVEGSVDIVTIGSTEPPSLAMAGLSPATLERDLPRLARASLAPHEAPRLAASQDAVTAAHPGRILVAEDNLTNQQVVRRILESAGHQVVIVGSGQDAVERIADEPFDLVLMDLNMPRMGGIEALKLMRFTEDDLPPVVALTADATQATIDACRAVGFTDYAMKPIDAPVLLGLMDRLIEARVRAGVPAAAAAAREPAPVLPPVPAPPSPPLPAAPPPEEARRRPVLTLAASAEPRPVLDRRKLDGLAKLDQGDGFIEEVIDTFLVEAGELVEAMAQAVEKRDLAALHDHAHALRSSAAHLGATALFDVLLGWRGLDDGSLQVRGPAEVQRLRLELDRVAAGLSAWRVERERSRRSGHR
ncbi:MAG TPA: ATP-binding protein [Geminicoccus sp.]|jgi:two-component system sensor histidine kinase RpfC|uniref:hybrid sensor histidine kinase/response regulator n=1 Tax=Geminicoccus sp. TaxID=2024832 RepID=UPI002E32DCFE|nr:ATP-binding protein [Geminicoccus sp.]HEX2525240.1 ATP-binding protein [Geminicoccus sp.]